MSGHSSIDSLRRLSPVSDAEAAEVFGVAGREALLETVTHLPFGRRRQPRRTTHGRRRPLVLALALVVAAGTAAAAWAILGSSARETTSVECVIRGTDTIIPAVSGDPASDCAVTWKNDLGTEPPPLVAYDNGNGGVTVIPRGEKPEAGWKPLASQDVELIQLQDSLDDYVSGLNSSCLDARAATSLAESKLARFGFTGWTVTVRSGAGACIATDIVDPARQTVTLIPSGPIGPASARTLADRLRPLTQRCESLPAAEAAVRAAAAGMPYRLNAVPDSSLHCAAVYETVGGTIFLTVRGPGR
jgi:hypothetical protein